MKPHQDVVRVKSGGKVALVVWSVGNFINHIKHKNATTGTSGLLMFRVGLRDDGQEAPQGRQFN